MTETTALTLEQTKEKLKIIAIVVIIYNSLGTIATELVQDIPAIQPYSPYIFLTLGNIGMIISVWYGIKIPGVPVTTIEPVNLEALKTEATDFQSWLEKKILELRLRISENRASIDEPAEYQKWLEDSMKEAMTLFDATQLRTADFVVQANDAWLKCNQR